MTRTISKDPADTIRIWNQLAGILGMTETQTSVTQLTEMLGLGDHQASVRLRLFRNLGMIDYRSVYEYGGQKVFFMRLVDIPEGEKLINKHWAAGRGLTYYSGERNKPRKVEAMHGDGSVVAIAPERIRNQYANAKKKETEVVKKTETVETVAIVGPDAESPMEALRPLRKNEASALLEAARQYIDRERAVIEKIAELEAMGVTIDHAKFRGAIALSSDPVLEAVAALLPEWDAMTKRVERMTREGVEWREELSALRKEANTAKTELGKEKDANRRLSERNVQLTAERTRYDETLKGMGVSLPPATA